MLQSDHGSAGGASTGSGSGGWRTVDEQARRDRTVVGVAALLALLGVLFATGVPVLDEESYLDIARQLDPLRPYDWWRPWQPWGTDREADAFVFAHPPLHLWWTWMVQGVVPEEAGVRGMKLVAGAPWALVLGWAVGDLARSMTRRPLLAVLVWASAPVVVLCLQRGLMPDLGVTALGTASVALWRRGMAGSRRALVAGGLCLALAVWTKYPAALLAPVLLWNGRRLRGSLGEALRASAPFWLAAAVPVVLGEAWLAWAYGRIHLVEVLSRADEIGRGHPAVRTLGLLARLGLAGLPVVVLLKGLRRGLAWGLGLGLLALLLAWAPAHLDLATAFRALPWAAAGGAVLALVGGQLRAPGRDRGPGVKGDTELLALWTLAVVGGVLLVHNFSAPRYLLPAAAPLALLLTRAAEVRLDGRRLLAVGVALSAALSITMAVAEHRFFLAADALASRVAATWASPGAFTGEWSFRWRMQQEGWTFLGPDTPSGSLVVAPLHSSPGALPEVKERVSDTRFDSGGFRVVCSTCRIGLYGDTLGVLPFGWQEGPLEEATAWRIR